MIMKKGFSIIEVVLAIIITGFSVVAIPNIIIQSTQNNTHAMTQEIILSAKMQMGMIYFAPWDENSYDKITKSSRAKIVQTDSKTQGLQNLENEGKLDKNARQNIPVNSNIYSKLPANNISTSKCDKPESINDFHECTQKITVKNIQHNKRGSRDFIFSMESKSTISYINDNLISGTYTKDPKIKFNFSKDKLSGKTSNIKMIQVEAKPTELKNKNITLSAYSMNIASPVTLTKNLREIK